MKEKPILFSTPMVQAILNGRKTMTRRVVKLKHFKNPKSIQPDGSGDGWIAWQNLPVSDDETAKLYPGNSGFKCPYGQPGDILWVRESFTISGTDFVRDSASGAIIEETPIYVFKGQKHPHIENLYKWKPSIHMPKLACRIWLEVVSVKVERLQEITEEDAIGEGVERLDSYITFDINKNKLEKHYWKNYKDGSSVDEFIGLHGKVGSARLSFATLWQSINGSDSWNANPWVWVIEFKRINN